MKFLDYLNEAYDFSFKNLKNYCEVFKNPSSDDLKGLRNKWVRFIIFDDNLYVWDGELACHDDVMRQMKRFYHEMTLGGIAHVKGNKLQCETGYDLIILKYKDLLEKIQKFKQYFVNFDMLVSSIKEIIGA